MKNRKTQLFSCTYTGADFVVQPSGSHQNFQIFSTVNIPHGKRNSQVSQHFWLQASIIASTFAILNLCCEHNWFSCRIVDSSPVINGKSTQSTPLNPAKWNTNNPNFSGSIKTTLWIRSPAAAKATFSKFWLAPWNYSKSCKNKWSKFCTDSDDKIC